MVLNLYRQLAEVEGMDLGFGLYQVEIGVYSRVLFLYRSDISTSWHNWSERRREHTARPATALNLVGVTFARACVVYLLPTLTVSLILLLVIDQIIFCLLEFLDAAPVWLALLQLLQIQIQSLIQVKWSIGNWRMVVILAKHLKR